MKLKVKCHSCLGFSLKRITYCIKIFENMHIAFTYMHLMKKSFIQKKKKKIHLRLLQNHAAYFFQGTKMSFKIQK